MPDSDSSSDVCHHYHLKPINREVMQLFSIGLITLNDDGTPVLDPDTGEPLQTYTNDEIQSFARAWTGFIDGTAGRGNIERGSELDPMQIVADWRDVFPKLDLQNGFIGDKMYPLCEDLPAKSFLKRGAMYRLLGGHASPESMNEPSEFSDSANLILRAELDQASQLYQTLYNEGDYQLTVELENDINCVGIECNVDTLRVVKVGAVYYEYIQLACVQLAFYDNGKKIQRTSQQDVSQICANPYLPHGRESCCRPDIDEEVQNAKMESGVTHLYTGERMTWDTAKSRCVAYGKDLCDFEAVSVSPSDDEFRKGYHWTDRDCTISVKVNR